MNKLSMGLPLAVLILAIGLLLTGCRPETIDSAFDPDAFTEKAMDGFYREDCWGDGRFAHLNVGPDAVNLLREFGKGWRTYLRIEPGTIDYSIPGGPATLREVQKATRLRRPLTGLYLLCWGAPGYLRVSEPFVIYLDLMNYGKKPIDIRWGGCHARLTGEAADPMEIQKSWLHLWSDYRLYSSSDGTRLISTEGLLMKGNACAALTANPPDLSLAPKTHLRLTLSFDKGLPVGKYDFEFFAYARSGKDGEYLPSAASDAFEITKPPKVIPSRLGFRKNGIEVTHEWMKEIPDIPNGLSFEDVKKRLGHEPSEGTVHKDKLSVVWWHFYCKDCSDNEHLGSYQASFEGEKEGTFIRIPIAPDVNKLGPSDIRGSILLTEEELDARCARVKKGQTVEEASKILGREPYSGYLNRSGTGNAYWRFFILDAKEEFDEWEILWGEFKNGKFVDWHFLPST